MSEPLDESTSALPGVVTDPRRVITLHGVHNFRDIGGYPTTDGLVTRWGRLFRADGLYRLTEGDLDIVRSLGLRTVLDLRSDEEIDLRGRFPFEYHPVEFHHIPIMDVTWAELPEVEITDRDPAEFLEWAYTDMLRESADRFAQAIVRLSEPDSLPAVFHCAAGKDRTGVLAMLLLGALRVRTEYIVADYGLTQQGMDRLREWSRREAPELYERMQSHPAQMMAAVPEAMHRVVDALVDIHGSIRDAVLHLGVPDAALRRLDAELLEAP
jgi:protein-tyrosine phosphatase